MSRRTVVGGAYPAAQVEPVRIEHQLPRRRDIQGLRAVAVMLVVIYHYFPQYLSGGFIGVDVFFVISGFLISLLLFKEIERSGRISLSAFYARRIRRLLPAAFVTMIGTAMAAALIVGPVQLVAVLQDMAWTAVNLANFHFQQATTGYFDTSEPSPFLHFWSLAVEEQYYLVWPLLLTIVLFVSRNRKGIFIWVLLAIIIGSLSASIVATNAGAPEAYFSLGTRAWELAIGGVLAYVILHRRFVISGRLRTGLSWVGVSAVAGSALFFTDVTPFPGWTAAIPSIGAAFILWAGSYGAGGAVNRLLALRPAQFIGNISYSLYLWHWPVLVLGSAFFEDGPGKLQLLVLAFISFVLAIGSYFLVERRLGRIRGFARSRRVLVVGLAVTLVASSTPLVASAFVPQSSGEIIAEEGPPNIALSSANSPITFDAQGPGIVPKVVPANLRIPLDELGNDLAEVFTNGCYAATVTVCEGGDPNGKTKIVLAGDSHAGQWWPAVERAARDNGWKLYIVGKNGCPLANVEISQGATSDEWPQCAMWQRDAPSAILALEPDLVVVANHAQGYRTSKASLKRGFTDKWRGGAASMLQELSAGSGVLLIGQTPTLLADPATCLSENILDVSACSTPLDGAVPPDLRGLNESLAAQQHVSYFDPLQLVCFDDVCPMITSNVVMYRDSSHLSATYSTQLSPKVAAVILAALAEHR
ncbi:acyltransferase family protein [Cryobacterium sp. M91]|uniref:acyltransferase family protein n=1 Tax=Cryobacterium sp. M91 TaxID=2048294 RepID=UPI000CE2BEBE|nr:acyltransferase family protein [Cryobacterium sp. M91]